MHVLHIFNEINFSGAEIMYANAAPLFQEKGIQMTAVNTGKKMGNYADVFEKASIKIIYRPISQGYKNPVFLLRYFRNVYRYIKKEKVDIVHVHRSDIFWYYSLCAAMAGAKTVMTPHNVFKNRKITWIKAYLERLTARKLLKTTFQTIGESVYYNELRYYKTPSVLINNWFNPGRFFPAQENEKSMIRKQLGIGEADFVVISAGGCSKIKNHSAIIDAMSIITKSYPCIYLHLGKGILEEEEIAKTNQLNLQEYIRFIGNKVNIRDYLVASDVYLMTSRLEGLSISAIEAMACSLPCILYNSPGLRDLIQDDNNGFLINDDVSLLAEKLTIFKNNPALAAEKGNNGRRFVSANFNMQQSVNEIIQLYNKI